MNPFLRWSPVEAIYTNNIFLSLLILDYYKPILNTNDHGQTFINRFIVFLLIGNYFESVVVPAVRLTEKTQQTN
jgi:hypothetical protein